MVFGRGIPGIKPVAIQLLETLGAREKGARLRIEGNREFPDHLHRRVPRPALDVANVGPMHTRFVAEAFLRKPQLLTP